MAYAKINSVTNANMAKVSSAAKAALGKIGSIDAPASGVDAPVTDGLIGYWRGDEGITTDTSGGTTTVSQWDNIASDRGGVAGQSWHMTQGTKADQPLYDASDSVVRWNGGSDHQSLEFDQTKVNYDVNYTIILVTNVHDYAQGFGVFVGGSNVAGYLRVATTCCQKFPYYRHSGIMGWYPPYDSTASNLNTTFSGYNILGWSFAANPSDSDSLGWITNQYLFESGSDADPANANYFSSPSNKPMYILGAYGGQTTNLIGQDIREVMIFNKQLNQTEVTAIHAYIDGIVTLNVLPDGMDYYGS